MSQNFHASVGYCCPIWLVKANNTRTRPILIIPSLDMVDAILLYVCTLSFSMSEWYVCFFSVFIGFWPRPPLTIPHCFKLYMYFVLTLSFLCSVLSLWGSYTALHTSCTLMWSPLLCFVLCEVLFCFVYVKLSCFYMYVLSFCPFVLLCCLFFFDIQFRITTLVSSNSSLYNRRDQFSR